MLRLKVKSMGRVPVPLPAYQTASAAGLDLCAALSAAITLLPGARALVPTGLAFEIPEGYEGQVRPRSGLALNAGISIVNAPGTIDADFRGELGIVLINHGESPFVVEPLARIAQLVIAPVTRAHLEWATDLTDTARAAGGYGSTGSL